jgi:large subunit ribosomal protein L14e
MNQKFQQSKLPTYTKQSTQGVNNKFNIAKMSADGIFKRFVEPGRLAMVRYGPEQGKLCTIVDLIDMGKVVVDGPTTGLKRQQMPTKWLALTNEKVKLTRGAREKTLKKALKAGQSVEKFGRSGKLERMVC